MSSSDRNGGAQVLLAFLAGAAAGAAVAFLTAPRSGRETRDNLRGWAHEAQSKAGRLPRAIREAANHAMRAARETFNEEIRRQEQEEQEAKRAAS
jgi:gas vesicle protein